MKVREEDNGLYIDMTTEEAEVLQLAAKEEGLSEEEMLSKWLGAK